MGCFWCGTAGHGICFQHLSNRRGYAYARAAALRGECDVVTCLDCGRDITPVWASGGPPPPQIDGWCVDCRAARIRTSVEVAAARQEVQTGQAPRRESVEAAVRRLEAEDRQRRPAPAQEVKTEALPGEDPAHVRARLLEIEEDSSAAVPDLAPARKIEID